MKRKTILTTVFSILGSIVLISGCGAGKTASAGGGVGSAPDCTQACIQSCSDSCEACCQEQCSDCSFSGSGSYNCNTLDGCISYCFDCNCMLFVSCIEQCSESITPSACAECMMSGSCVSVPSDESESAYFEEGEGKRELVEGDDYIISFEGGKISIEILNSFEKMEIVVSTFSKENNLFIHTYTIRGCFPAGSIKNISLVEGETASTHNVSVVSAYGAY